MTAFFLRPIRQLVEALVSNDSSRQVAWGVLLGMFIGLVPKGNLLAMLLMVLLLALRVNKSAGLMAAAVFAVVGLGLDPLAHRIGAILLTAEGLRGLHATLYQRGISPWWGLNNTVVVGQLQIGCVLAYPVYRISHHFAARVQQKLGSWLMRFRAVRWLKGVELGSTWGIGS